MKTIYVQVWIESPDAEMTPAALEVAVKTAILQSNRICRGIEIDKIECEADMDARDTKMEAA